MVKNPLNMVEKNIEICCCEMTKNALFEFPSWLEKNLKFTLFKFMKIIKLHKIRIFHF